ncbi:MAG: cell division protein SepF [Bacilli bacterium]|jgi:cell division inhibitor SepF
MGLDKLKKLFVFEDDKNVTTPDENEYYSVTTDAFKQIDGANKMILLEPRAYSEAQQVADHLKNRHAVIVNLKRVTAEQAKRIVDFLSGTVYAIGGDLQRLGSGIFLCTPNNMNVQGKITDEEEATVDSEIDDINIEW